MQTISLWQTQLRICNALADSKGAEGAHINFISHTNHSFIWRYLFDNAHTVADVVIFGGWMGFFMARAIIETKYGLDINLSYSANGCTEMGV